LFEDVRQEPKLVSVGVAMGAVKSASLELGWGKRLLHGSANKRVYQLIYRKKLEKISTFTTL